MKKRVVLAFGGNALQKNGEVSAEAQKKIANEVGEAIYELSNKYEIVIAHGNGPQVGNILIHEEAGDSDKAPAMPLETAVAMSQGQIGYWLTQAINNAFISHGKQAKVVTVVSQVVVSKSDPAFKNPTKPIGQFYSEKEAKELAREKGWVVKEDAGRGWRRVVASPRPIDIVEKKTIIELISDGVIVIAAGGGGIPVYRTKVLRRIKGVDAVIDKDFAGEKLAELVKADIFVSVTAVPNACVKFGTPEEEKLGEISVSEISKYLPEFKAGSMLPKVQAAMAFAEKNKVGIITDIEHLKDALSGRAGTIITK
ncbi:carbamate kinase [Candidatus Saccharibacteria bacterium]|nr:carbamate kinase [Candidatus Saccharibacteria bacterium]